MSPKNVEPAQMRRLFSICPSVRILGVCVGGGGGGGGGGEGKYDIMINPPTLYRFSISFDIAAQEYLRQLEALFLSMDRLLMYNIIVRQSASVIPL